MTWWPLIVNACILAIWAGTLWAKHENRPQVSQQDLHEAHRHAQARDDRRREALAFHRAADRQRWRVHLREAEAQFYIRQTRKFWDGKIGGIT